MSIQHEFQYLNGYGARKMFRLQSVDLVSRQLISLNANSSVHHHNITEPRIHVRTAAITESTA